MKLCSGGQCHGQICGREKVKSPFIARRHEQTGKRMNEISSVSPTPPGWMLLWIPGLLHLHHELAILMPLAQHPPESKAVSAGYQAKE